MKKALTTIVLLIGSFVAVAQRGVQVNTWQLKIGRSIIECQLYDGRIVKLSFPKKEISKVNKGDTIMIIRENIHNMWNFDKDYAPNTPIVDVKPYYNEYLVFVRQKR